MNHPDQYRNQEVVILGMARSGQAVARVFQQYGAQVVINDRKPRSECPEADDLEAQGIKVLCGGHPDDLISAQTALVVKNPGIPYEVEPVQRALQLGIEVVTEVEVAGFLTEAPMIGITGSNGKTTTTTWIGQMLRQAGKQPIVAGNIGTPLCEAAQQATDDQWIVAELSSFQLKGTHDFHPKVAILLNLYETHLDYHHTWDDYKQSKEKLFANQTDEDIAILNQDAGFSGEWIEGLRGQVVWFSSTSEVPHGMWIDHSGQEPMVVYRDQEGTDHTVVEVSRIGLKGAHNLENALAASCAALSIGVSIPVIREELVSFSGVEHRQERVTTKQGVTFYNDSKATNPTSTIKAIEAFDEPVILIAGGLDRGSDYMELLPYFRDKLKGIVALGQTRHKLEAVAAQAGLPLVKLVDNDRKENVKEALEQAVGLAFEMASDGDVILLSPACASWDMFATYEQRGRIFKDAVHNL
ncbi:UDP-N-acetylmuramoyl-L-alanine--D-glutamate ligase [Marinicrinis sediminis]|uniref:UDP-N-acetylmuramoylalanine--D-glutamate ligase n=1 Tax=Marinicrinis sediminis TaxID=1652465 RepID=A0ABW5RCG7_9BACL